MKERFQRIFPFLVCLAAVHQGCFRSVDDHHADCLREPTNSTVWTVNDKERETVFSITAGVREIPMKAIRNTDVEAIRKIESDIARLPDVFMCFDKSRSDFIASVCDRISCIQPPELRSKYFRLLLDSALSIRFEKIGNVHAVDANERKNVSWRLGLVRSAIDSVVEEIHTRLVMCGVPVQEQFEPFFKFFERMREETNRIGTNVSGYPGMLHRIEYTYHLLMESDAKTNVSRLNEYEWVRRRFEKVAGRPMRSLQEMSADPEDDVDAHLLIGEARAAYERRKKVKIVK